MIFFEGQSLVQLTDWGELVMLSKAAPKKYFFTKNKMGFFVHVGNLITFYICTYLHLLREASSSFREQELLVSG